MTQLPAIRDRDKVEKSLQRLQKLATLMDDQFELPIIKHRIGLDPIIGLIPGGGDWVTWGVSAYIIVEAIRLKVPIPILFKIGKNITGDFLVGYVPGVGDILDAIVKANKRSVKLILDYFDVRVVPDTGPKTMIEVPQSVETKSGSSNWRYPIGFAMIGFFGVLALVPLAITYLFYTWWVSGSP